jgi:hypothetical protein
MALTFTDPQIVELTQAMVDYPVNLASANSDLANANANQAKILSKDQSNTVFTNNWINIIAQYHAELKYLNGILRTDYNPADIDPAGRLTDPNIHFITSPIWVNFQPGVAASNLGNPTSAWTQTENAAITTANTNITLLKAGFTDGAANTTTTAAFIVDTVAVTSAAGFSIGNRVIFISGSNYLYGTITNIAGLNVTVTIISANASYAGIASGATMKNFDDGWTLAERESGVGSSAGDSAFMAAIKTIIDTNVGDWETRLNAELAALNLNDATGAEATQITAAKGLVNGHKTTIDTWQAFPSTGVGTSRFGTNLPALETALGARPAQITARIPEITGALGTLSQAGDGSFSGAGQYFNLFDNLNTRLNKAGGTLRTYYDSGLAVTLFSQMITNLTNQYNRDSAIWLVQVFSADATGTNTVTLTSVTGLAVSDTVKVCSKTQPVIDATITGISGLDVTLSVTIPSTYKSGESARIVKEL